MNIKKISVAFNLDDPEQSQMYEYARQRTNFSSYLKLLLYRDMFGVPAVKHVNKQQDEPKDTPTLNPTDFL